MKSISIVDISGLPETFGQILLVLFLILTLSPYLAGSDFGIFKVPNLGNTAKSRLKIWGPIMLIIGVLIHVPFIKSPENVTLRNPFGENQILLNSKNLLEKC